MQQKAITLQNFSFKDRDRHFAGINEVAVASDLFNKNSKKAI
jgi:hypothetical protein